MEQRGRKGKGGGRNFGSRKLAKAVERKVRAKANLEVVKVKGNSLIMKRFTIIIIIIHGIGKHPIGTATTGNINSSGPTGSRRLKPIRSAS